jgi:osmotically-inducible protein OsmY
MRDSDDGDTDEAAAPKHGAIGHLSADEELQQAVCQALIEDTELDSSEIRVRVAQETVMLSGSVASAVARDRAVAIAKSQRGVAGVQADELRCSRA